VLRNPLITTYLKMGQGARTKTISFRTELGLVRQVLPLPQFELAEKLCETILAG
jgi:hypothetical protein